VSDVHQVIGQMIKGDFDDESNWQIVEYIFDKLTSEGCGLGMRFYNALLEALWWMFQRERAARVLNEASKRGLFPELFRKSKLVWSVDVHRYSGNKFFLNVCYLINENIQNPPVLRHWCVEPPAFNSGNSAISHFSF